MGFQYAFEASDSAWGVRHDRSDELDAVAEVELPSPQQLQCGLRGLNVGKNQDRNTRVARMRMHLLSSPRREMY